MNAVAQHTKHKPIIRAIRDEYFVICEECDKKLDYRPLNVLCVRTDEWDVEQFESHTTFVAMEISSGNALAHNIRDEQDAVAFLRLLQESEPEALDHVVVIEFDVHGMPLRSIGMNRIGDLEYK